MSTATTLAETTTDISTDELAQGLTDETTTAELTARYGMTVQDLLDEATTATDSVTTDLSTLSGV
jgi:hypothetical protein